jgi:hypothetical protein
MNTLRVFVVLGYGVYGAARIALERWLAVPTYEIVEDDDELGYTMVRKVSR